MKTNRHVVAALVCFLTLVLLFATSVAINKHDIRVAIEENNRQWCDLVTTLNEGYTAPAKVPPSGRGQRIAEALRALAVRFGCS